MNVTAEADPDADALDSCCLKVECSGLVTIWAERVTELLIAGVNRPLIFGSVKRKTPTSGIGSGTLVVVKVAT